MASENIILQNMAYILAVLVAGFILYRIRSLYTDSNSLEKKLKSKYKAQGLEVKKIRKLSFKEKLTYGETLGGMFIPYQYSLGIMSGSIQYSRMVELIHEDGVQYAKYIAFIIQNKEITNVHELASHEM